MLISDYIKMKWHIKNYEWFTSKGYNFTKWHDEFLCKATDLMEYSKFRVIVRCDYCGKIYDKSFSAYLRHNQKSVISSDCCINCIYQKREESLMKTYGVKSCSQLQSTKEKTKQTCLEKYGCEHHLSSEHTKNKRKENNLEKYGVEHISQLPEIKEKKRQTFIKNFGTDCVFLSDIFKEQVKQYNLDKFGVEHYSQTEEYKVKMRNTSLERFGCKHPSQNKEIKEKVMKTNLKKYGQKWYMQSFEFKQKTIKTNLLKYGCENVSQNKEIVAKILKTSFENGTQKSSNQQRYICQLLNGELNYPISNCSLDILLDNKVYIEYNGGGHWLNIILGDCTDEEFNKKEMRRNYFLSKEGYKKIEIISREDNIPSDDNINKMIAYAIDYINTNHSWITFDIDNSTVKCSQYEKDYDFGNLRKIKKSDLSA